MSVMLTQYKPEFEAVIEHMRGELVQMRTGRATPAIVEDLMVEAYGAPMTIKGTASVNVADAKTLVIEPWDKGLLKAIEKAIQESNIGINPVVDGKVVRLVMPPMTEESRKQLVKVMKEKLEQARVSLRGVREKAREEVVGMEKEKEIGEDEKFRLLEELEKMVKDSNEKVKEIGEKKEEEINVV